MVSESSPKSTSDDAHAGWMEGHISIGAAMRGANRPVEELFLRREKWSRATERLRQHAVERGIPVALVGDAFFAANASGSSHGGVMARVGPRRFSDLASLIAGRPSPFLVMLDGIEDPFNFGQAVRALYAAGVSGLVLRRRNWLSATAVVTRASAGATELMPTAVAANALEAAAVCREKGMRVACTARRSAQSLYETDLLSPMFLLIGGEKRGVTRSFREQADVRLSIPYGRAFSHSLGAAASTAVVAFEFLRQRTASGRSLPDPAKKTL